MCSPGAFEELRDRIKTGKLVARIVILPLRWFVEPAVMGQGSQLGLEGLDR